MMIYRKNAKYEKQRRPFSDPMLWAFLMKGRPGTVSPQQRRLEIRTHKSGMLCRAGLNKYLLNNGALTSCLINKGPYSATKISVSMPC